MNDAPETEALDAIRAGTPLKYGYDVYGTGRVKFTISWDAAAEAFVEERWDEDLSGDSGTSRTSITPEVAARHVRASKQG